MGFVFSQSEQKQPELCSNAELNVDFGLPFMSAEMRSCDCVTIKCAAPKGHRSMSNGWCIDTSDGMPWQVD